jgi:PKD repeat protein
VRRRSWVILLGLGFVLGLLTFSGCTWFQKPAEVDFGFDPASGGKPLLVDFEPILDGTAVTYAWDFGDGSSSTEAAPSHVYYTAGTYTVTLTVTYDTGACASAEKTDCIEVRSGFTSPPKTLYWINGATHDLKSGPVVGGHSTSLYGGIFYGLSLTIGTNGIYCLNGNSLYKAAFDGSSFVFLNYYYGTPVSLCSDPASGELYMTVHPSYYGNGGIVVRSEAIGSHWEDWALNWGGSGAAMPSFLASDPATGRLYCLRMYFEYGGVSPRAQAVTGLDPIPGVIEWTDTESYSPHSIITGLNRSGGMAIDSGLSAGARYVYWTDVEKGQIDRCKIDGSSHVTLVSGLVSPGPIAVDVQGGKIYWGDADGIHRADLDGTGQELIYPGANAVSIAVG